MSSSNDNKLCLGKISRLYPIRAFYETHSVKPKTRVELHMLKASAYIRSTPEWADKLNDAEKCLGWTIQVKDTFGLANEHVEYIFEELKYYALLKENGMGGEEPGAIDYMWITNAASNCELAEEFKCGAAVLESDFIHAETTEEEGAPLSGFKALVNPSLYSFSGNSSFLFETPIATPEAALNANLSQTKPGSPEDWIQAVEDFNSSQSTNKCAFDKREVVEPVRAMYAVELEEEYMCWLPTDFNVNEDGSVTIHSYINNLHPVRYATLYQSISKVFAKFVPLLEQVTTDVIYPRKPRAEFVRELCFKPGMPKPTEVYNMFQDGDLPEEYQKYLRTISSVYSIRDEVSLDMEALYEAYEEAEIYTEPIPKPFSPTKRPQRPYSLRGMPLQASVEMASIKLTPENPTHTEGEWQAVGRAEERIFAIGLYFYDVENIASAKLKFRDPVAPIIVRLEEGLKDFCRSHVVEEGDEYDLTIRYQCLYTQEVGDVEIKSGSYICYPNFYQTKMPTFELADPTRPGHVKYIAFYIADPAQRLVSTQIVPPQQPDWFITSSDSVSASVVEGMGELSLDNAGTPEEDDDDEESEEEDAAERAERLQRMHAKCNRDVARRFSIYVMDDES
ncbi:hypothetical protein GGI24_002779 [Coemansia furcata]|nr:hypothetical protein GGI24_002779 [Coemansia furcata]